MGKRVPLSGRDQAALEALIETGFNSFGRDATATQIETYVEDRNLRLHGRWELATPDPQARLRFIRRRRPDGPLPRPANDVVLKPSAPRSAARRSPLWIIGEHQKADLDPVGQPPNPNYGALRLFFLNRSNRSVKVLSARIGWWPAKPGGKILPRERLPWDCIPPDPYDLFGGTEERFRTMFSNPVIPRVFRHPVVVRYTTQGRRITLDGVLTGDITRCFYEFEAEGERTPIY